jgi:hypothetical protein
MHSFITGREINLIEMSKVVWQIVKIGIWMPENKFRQHSVKDRMACNLIELLAFDVNVNVYFSVVRQKVDWSLEAFSGNSVQSCRLLLCPL